jgi:adenine-specific DNA-methyltransferase
VEGGSNTAKQEKINERSYEEVLKKLKNTELKALLSQDRNGKPLLWYQISRFTAKNTKDYFIHKNLKKFLSEQLDYFIKAEVLDIETLEKERFLDKHITRAKVVKEIGEDIIYFLSQIEDFQKKLWEKKKFVLKTEYVITTDRVPEEFYDEIWKNKAQKKEWNELGFEIPEKKEGLKDKKLPIDTKYFSPEFKEELLEKLTNSNNPSPLMGEGKGEGESLDDLLDGLLIKSENYQSLNTILGKYKEKIQTIYIDPPFNKEQDADYLYNVRYKDSTWASILENRLRLARDLLNERGSIFVRCDYNGNWLVRPLMNEIFGEENFRNEIVVNRISKKGFAIREEFLPGKYPVSSDSLYLFVKGNDALFNLVKLPRKIEKEIWHALDVMDLTPEKPKPRIILGKVMYPPKGRKWMFSQENIYKMEKEGLIKLNAQGKPIYKVKSQDFIALDSNWTDIPGYSSSWDFKTENSEILLKRVIESTSNESDLVMDFFLGSGTTTAVAHKLKRKWLGVEMGEHFWTVVLPRMKKVLAYDKSGISKEKDVKEKYNEKSAGGFFKYQILEQYEDTLGNIELKENEQAELKFGDDYLLKYFLDYETRESPYLLNIDSLKNPFTYKLKVNLEEVGEPQEVVVDIPETFNYLLGLKVKKVKARNTPSAVADTPLNTLYPSTRGEEGKGRKYLFILGEKQGKDIAAVWREYEDTWSEEDFKKDKEFIIKELEPWAPHIVYVNGQSVLTQQIGKHKAEIRYIEPEFKRLMG